MPHLKALATVLPAGELLHQTMIFGTQFTYCGRASILGSTQMLLQDKRSQDVQAFITIVSS